jgi:hypothetical protein
MNILLWVLQIFVALFCTMGAMWRFANRKQATEGVPSLKALSLGVYYFSGLFEIACSLGLILPGLLNMDSTYTPIAALSLALEQLAITALHVKFFGFKMRATNPGVWTGVFFILAAIIAYGRTAISPL